MATEEAESSTSGRARVSSDGLATDEAEPATSTPPRARLSSAGRLVKHRLHFAHALAEDCRSCVWVKLPFGRVGMTELLAACCHGDVRRAQQRLMAAKAEGGDALVATELAATDDWAGSSALHWAAYAGNAKLIKLLIDSGAQVDAVNTRDQSTPLHLAARYGRHEAVAVLASADQCAFRPAGHPTLGLVDSAFAPASTPLPFARSSTIHTRNDMGNTPLHESAR